MDIDNEGQSGESGIIRIGTPGTHTGVFVAGIYGSSVSGNAVVVSASGQLGVVVSSERYKTGIKSMDADSQKLAQLRPVTFHLKTDPKGAVQYGLIAEEVAKIYPELVLHDDAGKIQGVRYDELAPMLLKELQKQQATISAQAEILQNVQRQLAALTKQVQSPDGLVASR